MGKCSFASLRWTSYLDQTYLQIYFKVSLVSLKEEKKEGPGASGKPASFLAGFPLRIAENTERICMNVFQKYRVILYRKKACQSFNFYSFLHPICYYYNKNPSVRNTIFTMQIQV